MSIKNLNYKLILIAIIAIMFNECKEDGTSPKEDPVITWSNPSDITVGTLLSATQLNATADVAGTFVYNPAMGTSLGVGINQDLKVDFTPADVATYNVASKTVKIKVTQPTGGSVIVFQSGFEEGNKSIWDDWDENPDTENQIISDPGPFNTSDNHVIRLAVPSGIAGGSDLIKVLPTQHESLYVRWYIKYEAGFNFNAPNHGGGLFAGDRNYLGQSGNRPNGDDFAISTIEYNSSLHTPQIYAYTRGMYQDCSNPLGSCWGDVFPCTSDDGQTYCTKAEDRDLLIPPVLTADKWYSIEMKFNLGTPSNDGSIRDGEISLWVDGQNYGQWNKLWTRTTSNLKINILWLSLFHHDGTHSDAGVLIDDVVVSTN